MEKQIEDRSAKCVNKADSTQGDRSAQVVYMGNGEQGIISAQTIQKGIGKQLDYSAQQVIQGSGFQSDNSAQVVSGEEALQGDRSAQVAIVKTAKQGDWSCSIVHGHSIIGDYSVTMAESFTLGKNSIGIVIERDEDVGNFMEYIVKAIVLNFKKGDYPVFYSNKYPIEQFDTEEANFCKNCGCKI